MSWRDPKFVYVKSEKMKPGYLAAKFKRILAEQRANAKEVAEKVEPLPAKKRA